MQRSLKVEVGLVIVGVIVCLASLGVAKPTAGIFATEAANAGIDADILEGVCRYESDSGKYLAHHNENKTWDVGYCQNHRKKSSKQPAIPSDDDSIKEGIAGCLLHFILSWFTSLVLGHYA